MNAKASLLAIIGLAAAIGAVGCSRDGVPRMVDVGGYRVRAETSGHGKPAVIFVSPGFGASLEAWSAVQPKVSRFTRTLSYDRGGTYKSDPAPLPRDSAHIAAELHALLRSAGLKPPCVLVGSSLGGIHVRVFAHLYPNDVAGIVLVDPSSEDRIARLQAEEPVVWQEIQGDDLKMETEIKKWPARQRSEYQELNTALQQVRAASPLPAVPLVFLTATGSDSAAGARLATMKLELHHALLQRVPGAKHSVTNKSSHNIPFDQPDLVVDAILDVVTTVRSHKQ